MIKTLLLLLKAGKLGKVLLSGGSMLLSVIAYSWIFGWWYAIGFVALIFVHEMGHYVAARQRGLDVGAPTFIPFVGAWVQLKDMPHNAETEAYVGIAGPLAGTLAGAAAGSCGRLAPRGPLDGCPPTRGTAADHRGAGVPDRRAGMRGSPHLGAAHQPVDRP